MTPRRILWAGLMGLAALAGCGQGLNLTPGVTLGNRQSEIDATVLATAATQGPGARLDARIERTGATATLTALSENDGATTWFAPNGVSLTTRDGLLIGSRAMVPDLLAADVDPVTPYVAVVDRVHRYLEGEQVEISAWRCIRSPAAFQTRVLAGRGRPVTHIVERCSNATSRFENNYWIDASGRIAESRQWLGPVIGHLRLVPR